jgi:hypothetical protein
VAPLSLQHQVAIELLIGYASHIGRRRLKSEPYVLHRYRSPLAPILVMPGLA